MASRHPRLPWKPCSADSCAAQTSPLVWLWHELRVGLMIAVIAAVFLTAMFGAPFLRTLVYSLCVGLSIQFLIEAGRYGLSHQLRRRDPHSARARTNWPGWAWMEPWLVFAAVAVTPALTDTVVETWPVQPGPLVTVKE
jgi:hypothetical protein